MSGPRGEPPIDGLGGEPPVDAWPRGEPPVDADDATSHYIST